MVVYAQPRNPFFCVENQTCSTDAHNLYARGLQDAAHLLFAPEGGKSMGWIQFRISPLN
jgi:aldose 1-epimerase